MAYFPFNPSKPAGADTPPTYSADDLNNIRALRDAVVCGFMPGWAFSMPGGDPANPTPLVWTSGVLGLRAVLTWAANQITAVAWEYSENSGGAWANINTGGTACAVTTAANGMITAVNKDAGIWVLAFSGLMRTLGADGTLAAHIAATGIAVHGLGNMSIQNKTNVDITGGTVQAVVAKLLARLSPAVPPLLASGVNWDWSATPTMARIAAGGTIPSMSGADDGEMKRLIVVGSGAITLSGVAALSWGVGMPVWGTNATIVNFVYVANTAKIYATTIPF